MQSTTDSLCLHILVTRALWAKLLLLFRHTLWHPKKPPTFLIGQLDAICIICNLQLATESFKLEEEVSHSFIQTSH